MANHDKTKAKFMEIYDSYADAIFRHCFFRTYNKEAAKDLAQETFSRFWLYLFQGKEVENARAFLYRIATNLIIDESRKKKAVSLDDLKEEGFDPGVDSHRQTEIAIDLKNALGLFQKLPEKYRDVLVMRFIDELSPKEIAEITGESENTVSVRISRGMNKVREMIVKKSKISAKGGSASGGKMQNDS